LSSAISVSPSVPSYHQLAPAEARSFEELAALLRERPGSDGVATHQLGHGKSVKKHALAAFVSHLAV
jgi:hypothetical protein